MTTTLSPDTITETDIVLTQQCEHSAHHRGRSQSHGNGPATHYAIAVHACTVGEVPTVYAACAEWAAYVVAKRDAFWLCPSCQKMELGHDMCRIIGPIT